MSEFTTPLIASTDDGRHWRLEKAFVYHFGNYPSDWKVEVPKGFVTDGASIPKLFHSIISPWDKYAKAAVVHDYLYQSKQVNRALSDVIFLEAMEVLGVSKIIRYSMYIAVRLFGRKQYQMGL